MNEKNIASIYSRYHIPVIIQQHQLRVAAVAKAVADAHAGKCDSDVVTQVGLLHDMGNIIKVQFDTFPETWEPEGVEYWKRIQADLIARYGADEHHATVAIAKEIGVSEAVLHCIDMIDFSHVDQVAHSGTLEEKIGIYADNRVGPFGVLSLNDRLAEAKSRYMKRTDRPFDNERHELIITRTHEIERDLFKESTLTPEDITDAHIAPLLEKLSCYTFA